MRTFWTSVLLLLSIAVSASAQNYPFPGDTMHAPVICSGCPGTNSFGQLNDGLPTFSYDTPISKHTGRFVDSSNTGNFHFPVRTVRAGLVRVAPSGRNRIYLALGGVVGAYTLDTFFSDKLPQGMVSVKNVFPGSSQGRTVFEKVSSPDGFFYAESILSGWSTPPQDVQDVLDDFDADDRGYLYPATIFGWGIASDPGGADGSHLSFVAQVEDSETFGVSYLMSLRSGASYYVYYSDGGHGSTLYDVTTAASPVFGGTRPGSTRAFSAWSKYEAGQRVALLNADGHARIYSYSGLIAGGPPLADLTPSAGKRFADLSFDDDGNLWLPETTTAVSFNLLRKATPSDDAYTTTTFDVYGPAGFSPRTIHASGGLIAVGGQVTSASDLRLLKVVTGSPQLQDTAGFIEKYYHRAPSGYAQPVFSLLMNVRLVVQGGRTYLFYSDYGLGDVYEVLEGPRVTSMAPISGSPAGGTNVDIYGSGFLPDVTTVTFDGLPASSSYVSPTHMTAIAPAHVSGSVDVVVSVPGVDPMTAPSQFTYILETPQQLAATATSTESVSLSWTVVPGALQYEVSRRLPAGTWTVIDTPVAASSVDGGRTAETTYVYRVRADDGAGHFSSSAFDLATTMSSASAHIVAGTPVLAADFEHLRTRVSAVRAAAGLFPDSFNGTLTGMVLAQHMSELRTALTQGFTMLGFAAPVYTDGPSLTGVTIKAVHLNELLDLMR